MVGLGEVAWRMAFRLRRASARLIERYLPNMAQSDPVLLVSCSGIAVGGATVLDFTGPAVSPFFVLGSQVETHVI